MQCYGKVGNGNKPAGMISGLLIKGAIWIAENGLQHNTKCKSESHVHHLCYLVSQGAHLDDMEEFDLLVRDAKYKCMHYGRVAKDFESLCIPEEL